MNTYLENIQIIEDLMHTEFAKKLTNQTLKGVINALYKDPDAYDNVLLEKAKEKNHNDIRFAPDGICGWKILFDVYGRDAWLEKYRIIRGSSLGELFWPCAMDSKKQTINQERYIKFGDRIDLTLYDIKNFLEDASYKMSYENKNTLSFFNEYKKDGGFNKFIEDFHLTPFTVKEKDTDTIQVIDLGIKDNRTIPLSCEIDFNWSNRYKEEKKRKLLENYLNNLVAICSEHKKENL